MPSSITMVVLSGSESSCSRVRIRSAASGEARRGKPRSAEVCQCAREFDITYMNSYFFNMKTRVSERGQITIPKAVRERLGIRPGQVLARISHSLVKIRIFSLQDVNEPGERWRMVFVRANAPVWVLNDA